MTMSRDRVKFNLPSVSSTHRCEYARILVDAFGITCSKADTLAGSMYKEHTIVCRPSRFARFLIYRNNSGIPNEFKALNPVLFTPQCDDVLDVSKNPKE